MEHPENSEEYKGLTVNKGVDQPVTVNPYLSSRKRPKRRVFSAGEYVEGIVKGDVTILSQAVTLVESVKPEHQVLAQEVIEKCLPYSGNSILDELRMDIVNADLKDRSFTFLAHHVFNFLLRFLHHLFDSGRMNSSVHNQTFQCDSCYFPSYRIKTG